MKRIFQLIIVALAFASCGAENFGITEIENPRADKQVAIFGETVAVNFMADGPWYAELELQGEGEWATISQMKFWNWLRPKNHILPHC